VRGTRDTALIFLHGLCGERAYWKHQVDAFAADYRIVTLSGASPPTCRPFPWGR
jgi:hypothetical protein